jgi:3-hydroxybutyryl-CoA dehydratase
MSAPPETFTVGAVMVAERTFTDEMVDAFTKLTGDRGRHHLHADAQGRRIVHGLLVAALGTEIGGRINFLSRTMDYEFLRPVYVGDTITCTARIEQVERRPGKTRLLVSMRFVNQAGEEVVRGSTRGAVLDG